MIDSRTFEELRKEWAGVTADHKIYAEWKRFKLRVPHFEQHMNVLKGKKLLEIGSNAGVHAYSVAPICASYVGVDRGIGYHKQSLCTMRRINAPSVRFIHADIATLVSDHLAEIEFNAFLACFALYHFSNKELELLDKHVWPKCDVVFIQNRNQRRPTPHNTFKFWEEKNIRKYFEQRGFKCTNHWGHEKKFSEVICERHEVA